nr:hypothetical protein [Tanacetum cinerariifolium]
CHPQQNSKNLGRPGLRHCRKYQVGEIQSNHDEGMHDGDLCIYPMPQEMIHQTVVESLRFHYRIFVVLEWGEEFIDEF